MVGSSQVNQRLYLTLMYNFIPYEKPQIINKIDLIKEEILSLLIHDKDFLLTLTGSGTNSKKNTIKKIEIWKEILRRIVGYPRNNPRSFSIVIKRQIFSESDLCQICNNRIMNIDDSEVDHIICYWRGGLTIPENARLVHRICNRKQEGNQ